MKKYLKIIPVLFSSAAMLSGCVTQQTPAPPQTTQIKCRIPQIDIVADPVNKETQSKGGLDITILPATYNGVPVTTTTTTPIQPDLGTELVMSIGDNKNKVYVEQVTTSTLKPSPARLEFIVTIHNSLNRVFHGQGSVVQFNVDSKHIPIDNADFTEFTGGIVPPNDAENFKIYGPPLDTLKDKGTITIFVYDVVTATDPAGNTTERQNYTWDFTYTMQEKTASGTFKKERGFIDMAQYQQLMIQQNTRQMQQMQKQAQENPAQ